jgi:hypothetical protein
MDDIATALTESINKDGTKAWAANQGMGGFKFTGTGNGSARTDSVALGQVQDGTLHWVAAGGTADAITATYSPAITTLVDGQICCFRASGANTITAPTFAPNGLTARIIYKTGGAALAVGDIVGADHEVVLRYKLTTTRWELVNAGVVADSSETVKGKVELATTAEAAALTDTARAVTAAGLAAAMAGKKAIWIDAGAMRAKVTTGADFSDYDSGSNDLTLRCADFDTTTQQYAHFKMAMPVIWDEGTVTFKPYWTNTGGASAETVVFSLAGAAFSNDDGINGTAFGTVQTSTDTWLAQNDLHVGPESSAITIAGTPAAGDLVVFEVSRVVGSDNMAGDARLIGLMLYITTNAFNEP